MVLPRRDIADTQALVLPGYIDDTVRLLPRSFLGATEVPPRLPRCSSVLPRCFLGATRRDQGAIAKCHLSAIEVLPRCY